MIALVRVDSRLIHGQVIEAWVPHLKVRRLVVADDEAATNPLMKAAMKLAVPAGLEVVLSPLGATDFAGLAADPVRTLVLVRDVAGAVAAYQHGLKPVPLNLGNVHAGAGRTPLTRAVHLSAPERAQLDQLAAEGVAVTAQAVPSDPSQAVG